MKKIMMMVLVSQLITNSVYANVASDVEMLGKLAFGVDEHSLKGKNAETLLTNWLEKEYGEDEERKLVFKEIESMAYGDETNEGFTSTRSAIEMKDFAISKLDEDIEDYEHMSDEYQFDLNAAKAKIYDLNKNWGKVIKRLEKQGVKFGYTGNGPGYCGISFVELLIIDPKDEKVYEVYLSESEDC